MKKNLIPLALFLLLLLPIGIPGALYHFMDSTGLQILAIVISPFLALTIYTAICIGFARLGLPALIAGRFPRRLDHPVYGPRRLYGTMWTAIYYFKPLYWLLLSTKTSKTILFRGFGYKGPIDMVTYPDTWIRDLPLLQLGKGAYLANKATIGTNMCLADGTILVDKITIGENSVIGHLCMLAPGTQIGSHSETGSGSAIGMGVMLGDHVRIGPMALINHGASITDGVKVGASCYIGSKVQINVKGLVIPGSTTIPDYAVINSESDLLLYLQKRA